MYEDLKIMFYETYFYLIKCAVYTKPFFIAIVSIISYVLFPDSSYYPATYALLGTLLLDIGTKYYAISVKNGGFLKALRNKKITSESLWIGTRKKIIGVLVVMILCGLSYRLTNFSTIPSIFQTVCFSILFLRESQSIIENLLDAGHEDLRWFLKIIKRKQEKIIENLDGTDINNKTNNEENEND